MRPARLPILRTMNRSLAALALAIPLVGCALPPPDQPAHYTRMGRFVGLVAKCGCGTGLTASQVLAGYPQVAGGRYSPLEIERMRGYVEAGATENFDNQLEICAEVCAQPCAVNAVAEPLGGRTVPGVPACFISERNLHLTIGRHDDGAWP